jgi:hypothetical protein
MLQFWLGISLKLLKIQQFSSARHTAIENSIHNYQVSYLWYLKTRTYGFTTFQMFLEKFKNDLNLRGRDNIMY